MSKTKTLATLALISAVAYGGYRLRSHHAADVDADKGNDVTVTDQIWVDHMPKDETDKFQVFLALSEDTAGEDIGIFQRSSMWWGEHELFRYEAKRGKLVIEYPQTGETEEVSGTATKCKDQRGMDYCLELDGASRGVHKYYSRKDWKIEGRGHTTAELEAKVKELESQLATQK